MLSRRGFIIGTTSALACGAVGLARLDRQPADPATRPLADNLVIIDGWVLREGEARAVFA